MLLPFKVDSSCKIFPSASNTSRYFASRSVNLRISSLNCPMGVYQLKFCDHFLSLYATLMEIKPESQEKSENNSQKQIR